jgi:hypothetical protein
MFIAGRYSFHGGEAFIQQHYPHLLAEIEAIIVSIDAEACKTKASKEKTMPGKMLYSPKALNKAFKAAFARFGWESKKEFCDYSTEYYTPRYHPTIIKPSNQKPYREMDFLKEKLGIEVQFGKYAFMVYNVCAKMTIFRNLGHINAGVEIVPVKQFVDEMSTGVAFFEQFTWDLKQRGEADIDIPVLILGIATENLPEVVVFDAKDEQLENESDMPPTTL